MINMSCEFCFTHDPRNIVAVMAGAKKKVVTENDTVHRDVADCIEISNRTKNANRIAQCIYNAMHIQWEAVGISEDAFVSFDCQVENSVRWPTISLEFNTQCLAFQNTNRRTTDLFSRQILDWSSYTSTLKPFQSDTCIDIDHNYYFDVDQLMNEILSRFTWTSSW